MMTTKENKGGTTSTKLADMLPPAIDVRRKLKFDLLRAVQELSDHGLMLSARWAAEQAVGIDLEGDPQSSIAAQVLTNNTVDPLLLEEYDTVLLAKTFFDLKEYHRTADALKNCKSSRAFFLRGYSSYLAGEKRKEEEIQELGEQTQPLNKELKKIKTDLETAAQTGILDGFGNYLYGILLKENDSKELAKEAFTKSVLLYPYNWSCWKDLATLCDDVESVRAILNKVTISGGHQYMTQFWCAHVLLELQQNNDSLKALNLLSTTFPKSNYLLAQKAIANYNLREFQKAEEIFEELSKKDKYRIENLDTYSNILYVNDMKAKLSYLAHFTSTTDKYRPETCCIIGNYYSLISEHEKAVSYFQRALLLNRRYLAAWTLMGHEYMELKNPHAAIQAYRRAVDINPRDYRAWYGLGQTYEILHMHLYALHYYRKATMLRPYDSRMWCAIAESYENLNKIPEAIICYERAENNQDRQGIALNKLAKLYQSQHNEEKTFYYYKKNLERSDSLGSEGQEVIDSLLFLANYYRKQMQLEEAEKCCKRLLDYAGKEKEEAKALLREIHSTQQHM